MELYDLTQAQWFDAIDFGRCLRTAGSVPVTLMSNTPLASAGGVPVNWMVEALKLSQDGRADPSDSVAV